MDEDVFWGAPNLELCQYIFMICSIAPLLFLRQGVVVGF